LKKDFESWKKTVKSKFLELIGYDKIKENDCPLNIQIEEEIDKGQYKQIRFIIESEKEEFVPCYLLIPNTGKEKYPVAITLQGHSTGFHNSIGVKKYPQDEDYHPRGQFALQAVKNGYIALAIEQRGMGERRPNERKQTSAHMCEYTAHIALLLGRTILGERMWDVSKAIDALSNFSQCDLDKIFITGNSGGGTMSYYAACFDERIKLSVPSCAFCTYKDSILNWYHCSCNFIPHAYEWFEMQDLSCLIAPRKLVIIAGKEDEIFPIYGVKTGYKVVEKIYSKAGAIDNCNMIETPKAHWWCEDVVWNAINTEVKKLGWI
jgi:dienelactone hydrolase